MTYELQQRTDAPPEMYLRGFGDWVVLTVLPSRDEADQALRNYAAAFPHAQFRICRNSSYLP